MSIYEATTPEALRVEVVALCVESMRTSGMIEEVAERIVPPVPVPEPVWREVPSKVSFGIGFRCVAGVVQAKHTTSDTWVDSLSVVIEDLDTINDLKANPTVTPKVEYTCIKCGKEIEAGARSTFTWCSPCWDADRKQKVSAPTTREPVEPVVWVVVDTHDNPYMTHKLEHESRACAEDVDKDYPMDAPHVVLPVYRNHPATVADAIALLVREGWREDKYAVDQSIIENKAWGQKLVPVRVLIQPTTGAAHE